MDIPTESVGIKAAADNIRAEIKRLEANIKIEKAKLTAVQSVCEHPDPETWNSNPMGRWPTSHFQCKICGFYKET